MRAKNGCACTALREQSSFEQLPSNRLFFYFCEHDRVNYFPVIWDWMVNSTFSVSGSVPVPAGPTRRLRECSSQCSARHYRNNRRRHTLIKHTHHTRDLSSHATWTQSLSDSFNIEWYTMWQTQVGNYATYTHMYIMICRTRGNTRIPDGRTGCMLIRGVISAGMAPFPPHDAVSLARVPRCSNRGKLLSVRSNQGQKDCPDWQREKIPSASI